MQSHDSLVPHCPLPHHLRGVVLALPELRARPDRAGALGDGGVMSDRDQAAALGRQADDLRAKGECLKVQGEALCRAAERLNAFAAAIADGRADDVAEIAMEMSR